MNYLTIAALAALLGVCSALVYGGAGRPIDTHTKPSASTRVHAGTRSCSAVCTAVLPLFAVTANAPDSTAPTVIVHDDAARGNAWPAARSVIRGAAAPVAKSTTGGIAGGRPTVMQPTAFVH